VPGLELLRRYNDLPIDDCRAAVKLGCCLHYADVPLSPIEAVAGIGTRFVALDNQESAVSVMLYFVDPARTRRRMIDCGCELQLDELERHESHLAGAEEIASPPAVIISRASYFRSFPDK